MNTINSVYYGWGFLILCGGGSYYFAKRSINADRHSRASAENERRQKHNRQIAQATHNKIGGGQGSQSGISAVTGGGAGARGKGTDAGAAGRKLEGMKSGERKVEERDRKREEERDVEDRGSEFEAQRPFRSRKGDRFS